MFVPVEDTGHARCPYCGTEFMIASDEAQPAADVAEDDGDVTTPGAVSSEDSEAVDIFG